MNKKLIVGMCTECKQPLTTNEAFDFCKEVQPGLFEIEGELDSSGLMCACDNSEHWVFYEVVRAI